MSEKTSIVLSAGSKYFDIDGYASIVALGELLALDDVSTKVLSASKNYSIPDEYMVDNLNFTRVINDNDKVIVLDTSDPSYIQNDCSLESVIEIFDHHPGNEDFWNEKLDEKSHIEPIGAVATLIYEKWVDSGKLAQMSNSTAKLLGAALLDNTLNFHANITTDRDRDAYEKLMEKIDDDITNEYFKLVQVNIEKNLEDSVKNDVKFLDVAGYGEITFGQLTAGFTDNALRDDIAKIMNGIDSTWIFNLIDVSDGRCIILASDDKIKQFFDDIFAGRRFLLRKEILAEAYKKDKGQI